MRIYIERDATTRGSDTGFSPRRVVEQLEGPRAGKSLLAMYDAGDAGVGVGAGESATLPDSGVGVGLTTTIRPEDQDAPAMAWGSAAWDWLNARVAAAEEAWGQHPGPRWVWPRVGAMDAPEVLSDVPSLRRFLKDREGAGDGHIWRFVLDPVGMLADSMMANAEEHVKRVLEMLGSHEACGAVVLCDVAVDARSEQTFRVPIGAGELSRRGLLDWWRRNCPAETPVILGSDASLAAQVGLLTSG